MDGLELYQLLRRPLPQSAESIGHWLWILQSVSWLSLVSNAGLLVWTLDVFHFSERRGELRYLYFLALLLALALVKAGLLTLVPSTDQHVEIAKDRNRQIIHNLKFVNVSIARDKVDADKDLLLHTHNVHSGELLDPIEFGSSAHRTLCRVRKLQARRAWIIKSATNSLVDTKGPSQEERTSGASV